MNWQKIEEFKSIHMRETLLLGYPTDEGFVMVGGWWEDGPNDKCFYNRYHQRVKPTHFLIAEEPETLL
jgi:hypothetical protein